MYIGSVGTSSSTASNIPPSWALPTSRRSSHELRRLANEAHHTAIELGTLHLQYGIETLSSTSSIYRPPSDWASEVIRAQSRTPGKRLKRVGPGALRNAIGLVPAAGAATSLVGLLVSATEWQESRLN
jgi:hypothetical protein